MKNSQVTISQDFSCNLILVLLITVFVLFQGLKRLMTFCQKKFPADPSKSVEYNAVK